MIPLILLVVLGVFLECMIQRIGEKKPFEKAYEKAVHKDQRYCARHPGCSAEKAYRHRNRVMQQDRRRTLRGGR